MLSQQHNKLMRDHNENWENYRLHLQWFEELEAKFKSVSRKLRSLCRALEDLHNLNMLGSDDEDMELEEGDSDLEMDAN